MKILCWSKKLGNNFALGDGVFSSSTCQATWTLGSAVLRARAEIRVEDLAICTSSNARIVVQIDETAPAPPAPSNARITGDAHDVTAFTAT